MSERVRIRDVMAAAADVLKLPPEAMTSRCRVTPWREGRQLAMTVAFRITGQSQVVIGRHFNRHGTTAWHAVQKIEARRLLPGTAELLDRIETEARKRARSFSAAFADGAASGADAHD